MAVSLQTQWTLVASGLVAHADHVLAGEECDRLMAMVEQEIDGDEYAEWMGAVADPMRLQSLLEGLDAPPESMHREILEEAWLMAVVDGERADEELQTLERIATHLGVPAPQLQEWREAWTTAQYDYADLAVASLTWLLAGDAEVSEDDHGTVHDFVHALPTTHEHREVLAGASPSASAQDIDQRVRALGKPQRRDLQRRLLDVISRPGDDEVEKRQQLVAKALAHNSDDAS